MSVQTATDDWRKFASMGYATIFLTFGVIGGWAAVAKIDRAVVATGFISTETNRKTLQHYEGGIVREILVNEGDHVREGQILLRLDKVQAQANLEVLQNQLDSALALEARLIAEREGKDHIAWSSEWFRDKTNPRIGKLVEDETRQFEERRASLRGQLEILEARIKQLRTEISGIAIEKASTEKQVRYINDELAGLRMLLAKQLVPANRVFAMERERTRLEGIVGKLISDSAKADGAINEIGVQIAQMKQKFQEDVATLLLDVRQKITDLRQRGIVANDVLRRIDVAAPRTGTIQNLKVFTIGQVLRPGEPILDIVPDQDRLIVQAQFSPTDIDSVRESQTAEIRFPAFHSRTLPVMAGNLETISHDRLVDETSKQPYYLGIIAISRAEIPEAYRSRLRAGMPAEVIVSAGERTVLDYLISPLSASLRKTFIEQ
jgi:HlyD family secretion protein